MKDMNIVITGGAGFLGSMLTTSLLRDYSSDIKSITVVDQLPAKKNNLDTKKVKFAIADITVPEQVEPLITKETTHVFHLAAIVSSHAEEDFDLGVKVNLHATQILLERCRQVNKDIRFVFSSSLAVFGGDLPNKIMPMTATQPNNSYGAQKAMCELLINDYGRRSIVDAVAVRLPTICIRPGVANKAASSFVSGIVREPLKREKTNCPVNMNLPIWISSPETVISNIIHAGMLSIDKTIKFRVFNLPGIAVTSKVMIDSLSSTAGKEYLNYISNDIDPFISEFMDNLPKSFDNSKELSLGFNVDKCFKTILESYVNKHTDIQLEEPVL
ncbi:D-erythronate dehydrogenase [Photobacterium sp. DNB23_23_1]